MSSDKKLLSLYDANVEGIVRGKSGNEVEFGQKLLLSEQADGLIIDWELFGKKAPSDSALLKTTIDRCQKYYGPVTAISADRAFNSAKNDGMLDAGNIINATWPRSPIQLQEKLKEPVFVELQTRRSQTEARIGIFKNNFLGRPLCSQILTNKQQAVTWCVLSHTLWLLARMMVAEDAAKAEVLLKAA